MTLIRQLQGDIVNPDISLASILLKAKILAYRLRNDELKNWVDSELNGYPDDTSIPCYRRYTAQNYGDFLTFDRHFKNVPISSIDLPDPVREFAQGISMGQGVGSLEDLKNHPGMRKDGAIQYAWPPEVIEFVAEHGPYANMRLVSAWKLINDKDITHILDIVRNKLLTFVLELQDQFPELTESDDKIGEVPPERITYMYNTHIHGNQNVVAAGTNITQNVQQEVRSNDLDSLLSYLKSIGVSEEDAQELKEAVEEDGPAEESAGFGPRVRDWLGKKTAEGALNATLSGIATTAAKAVAQYYGWLPSP